MRATRDLLRRVEAMAGFYRHSDGFFRLGREARAEVEAMERVVEAAREAMAAAPALMSDTPFAHRLNDLGAALAELDGQTPDSNAAVTERASRADVPCARCGSKPSTETRSLKYGEPWCNVCWDRPLACPCRVHGDPDGDCGEECA